MFKKLILIILLFSINYLKGAELEIKIAHYPKEVIKGEPCNIRVTISNVSGKEIIIAGGFYGLDKEFIVKRADGRKRKEIISELENFYTKEYEAKALSSDFKSDFTENIFERYDDEAGEFIVQFKISSYIKEAWSGSIYKGEKVKTWTGVVYSEEIHIFLKEPTEIDKEAYDYFEGHPLWKKEDLLDKYSTSIYAGWALWARIKSHGGGFMGEPSNAEPEKYFQCLHNPNCSLLYEEQFAGEKKDEWKILRAEKAAEWRDNKIRIILQYHPDFMYADELRLRLAMDYLALDNYEEASSEFNKLADLSFDSIAIKRAKKYLSLMKDHALIKTR